MWPPVSVGQRRRAAALQRSSSDGRTYGRGVDEVGLDARVVGGPLLVAEIAKLFDLGRVKGWRDLGGSRSTNLLVATATRGSFVARVHRRSTSWNRLCGEQAARRVLAVAGVPTVVPLADRTGATVQHLGCGHLVELERYVPSTATMNTPELMRLGFTQLARVHDVLRSAELPGEAQQARWANHIGAGEAAEATRRGAERIRQWADRDLGWFADAVTLHIDEVARAEQEYQGDRLVQIVHGDFWDNNVLIREDRVAAVLDFGFMAEHARVDDLALPFWFHLLEPGRHLPTSDDVDLLRDLVRTYDQAAEVPLSAAERASLPLAIGRQPAWSIGGWILRLGEADAVRHAHEAAAELPVALSVMRHLEAWQHALR
jgi:homoserine kinase type II